MRSYVALAITFFVLAAVLGGLGGVLTALSSPVAGGVSILLAMLCLLAGGVLLGMSRAQGRAS